MGVGLRGGRRLGLRSLPLCRIRRVGRMGRVVDLAQRDALGRAIRAQSSYSGLNVGGRSSSHPSLPRIGPKGVSTSTACRLSLWRLTG